MAAQRKGGLSSGLEDRSAVSQRRGKAFLTRAQVATQGALRTPSTRGEPVDLGADPEPGVLLLTCSKHQGFEKKHRCLGPAQPNRPDLRVELGTVLIEAPREKRWLDSGETLTSFRGE